MKKSFLLILLVLNFVPLFAQYEATPPSESPEIRTLFGKPTIGKVGFYVGPEFAYTQFDSKSVYLVGLSGGAIINHNFSIGLSGFGIVNSGNLNYPNIQDSVSANLYGGYGGLKLEYRLWPSSPINVSFPLLIGSGLLAYSTYNWDTIDDPDYEYNGDSVIDSDMFFVIEPGVMVGMNVLKFMRVDIGLSYRHTAGLHLVNTNDHLMNNFSSNVALRFGLF